jgi:hypothetical protein
VFHLNGKHEFFDLLNMMQMLYLIANQHQVLVLYEKQIVVHNDQNLHPK